MSVIPTFPTGILDSLTAAIGIDPLALDPGRLKWILNARCRLLHLAGPDAYAAHLQAHPDELDALIDQVVVPETRFFRDRIVFDHIRDAAPHLAATAGGPLRILSAPCGTGQEAWSIAALLTHLELPFHIDAVDISLSALATARRGIYAEDALAHVAPELHRHCGFRRHKQFHVHAALRPHVHFERRNLAEPGVLGPEPRYHLILCRNLFIYLGPEARAALARSLATALLPHGRLILGTADRVEELTPLFAAIRPAASFAFQRQTPKPAAPGHAQSRGATSSRTMRRTEAAEPQSAPQPASSTTPCTAIDFLTRALEHRSNGDLAKAERSCRKALYLAPGLLPALELLQSLWSENPSLRLRRALRDRILRTQAILTADQIPDLREHS